MSYSLLDAPLFRVRLSDDTVENLTLPEILARLSTDDLDDLLSFEALQAHQQQAWYSFLVQLAAMAVARETGGERPTDPAGWRDALVGLADGSEAAWHLVVDDLTKPAFLQSPVLDDTPDEGPELDEILDDAGYKADVPTPDRLDVLVTSKNHDVKRNRIAQPRPEHWIYALCTLQTMEGFLGRGNYGIVRMNGGFGNRPLMGLAPDLSWGNRFRRDLDVLLNERDRLADSYELDGPALIWTEHWDGSKDDAIWLYDCDPYFIEICRRIRLTNGDALTCWRANTKGQRIDAPDDLNGITQDPWTPIDKGDAKALTVGGSGFTYQLLQDILFEGEYARPPALTFDAGGDEGAYVVAQVLARGKGKTEGLHRRIIFVPNKAKKRLFGTESERKRLGKRAKARVKRADDVQSRLLYPAIAILLGSGEGEDVDYEDVAPWIDRFDRAVDDRFFEALWTSVEEEMDEAEATAHWESILWDEAEPIFEDAERSTPIADARRWRARSRARSVFYGQARSVFASAPYTSTSDTSARNPATT
jgi:CRISPR system Cascade subunit CasA